jgi:hypothetical protein
MGDRHLFQQPLQAMVGQQLFNFMAGILLQLEGATLAVACTHLSYRLEHRLGGKT